MKAMGFRWDEERRTWTRRPPDVKKPPKPLRSGMRLLKLGDASPDERAAAEVFMERLRTARKASFRDTDTSTKLSKFLKYCLSQPATLPVFAVACVGLGAAAGTGAELGGIDATTLTCGLAAGVPVAAARVAAHKASAGSEPPDGRALERSIVDAATGSYAIPAPHDWRATEGPWKAGTIGLAAIADVPRVALLHGRIQPSFVPLEGDQWLGIAGAAAVATLLLTASGDRLRRRPAVGFAARWSHRRRERSGARDGRTIRVGRARAFSRRPTTPRLRGQSRVRPRASPTPGRRPSRRRHRRRACAADGRRERARGRGVGVRRPRRGVARELRAAVAVVVLVDEDKDAGEI